MATLSSTKISIGVAIVLIALSALLVLGDRQGTAREPAPEQNDGYAANVLPQLTKYCTVCHSTKEKKGSLDLERFATVADARKDLKLWQVLIEQIEASEMPPKDKPQLTAEEKKKLLA